jgi:hypothetical protein
MAKTKKYAAGGESSPDQIVADIDRRQNEEDRDLIPRAGRVLMSAADSAGQAIRGAAGKAFMAGKNFGNKISGNDTDQAKLKRMGLREGSEDYEKGLKTLENNRKKLPSEMTKKHPLEMKSGGSVSSASKRADGCAVKGKTRGKMV